MSNPKVKPLFTGCPDFFVKLQDSLCGTNEGKQYAREKGFNIETACDGAAYVDQLMHAARQYRYANALKCLTFGCGVAADKADVYGNIVKLVWSVAALEQYAKLTNNQWYEYKTSQHFSFEDAYCDELRKCVKVSPANKIKASLKPKHKENWEKFVTDDNKEALSIGVAIRHAFAHGEVWGAAELDPHLPGLYTQILDGIQRDIENHIDSVG